MSENEKNQVKELCEKFEKLDENGRAIIKATASALAARQEMEGKESESDS